MMPRPRRRISTRHRPARKRPAGGRQWHHHGVSRRHLVVGARACAARRMRAPSSTASNACGPGSAPTPATIFATRPTISMPSPRSSNGSRDRRIDAIAFNDHMTGTSRRADHAHKFAQMVERSGLTRDDFLAVVERTRCRADEVPGLDRRLAAAANASGVPLLSHDDTSPEQRRWFRSLGCRLAEFPTTVETAEDAASQGDDIVLGAPNVVRGGSHTGWIDATEMIGAGILLGAGLGLLLSGAAAGGLCAGRRAASCRSSRPGGWCRRPPPRPSRLADRGDIALGRRADLIIVDASARRSRASSPPSSPAGSCISRKRISSSARREREFDAVIGIQGGWTSRDTRSISCRRPIPISIGSAPASSAMTAIPETISAVRTMPGSALPAWAELTREPRKYGFHATLKAPFRLAAGIRRNRARRGASSLCRHPPNAAGDRAAIQALGRFIAIVPGERNVAVDRLAADCVMAFDRFRRPPTADEKRQTPRRRLDRSVRSRTSIDGAIHMSSTTFDFT